MSAAQHHYKSFRTRRDGTLRPAAEAWAAAKQHVLFITRLGGMVATDQRRSRAARKGWKTRRAKGATQ